MTRPSSVEFSIKTERAAKKRAKGKCEGILANGERCNRPFDSKNRPECDHIRDVQIAIDRGEKPDNSLANCQVLGRLCCHRPKTSAATTRRAKADRVRDKNVLNITRPKAKIQSRGFQTVREAVLPGSVESKQMRAHIDAMAKAGKQIVRPHWLKEKRRG